MKRLSSNLFSTAFGSGIISGFEIRRHSSGAVYGSYIYAGKADKICAKNKHIYLQDNRKRFVALTNAFESQQMHHQNLNNLNIMPMKRILIFPVILWISMALSAQQVRIYKFTTDIARGASMASGNIRLVYAAGEIASREVSASGLHLSEGFVGPDFLALLGISDYETLKGVSLYPNPAGGFFNVSLPQSSDYDFYFFDATGKQIFSEHLNTDQARFTTESLSPGFYFLVIIDRSNRKQLTLKIEKL